MASPLAKPEKSLLRYTLQASLRKLNAARPLAPEPVHIERFLALCHRRHPSKSPIIRPGDMVNTLYYIIEGSLAVMSEDDEGRELILAYVNEGDFIGEMGLFYGAGKARGAGALADALRTRRDQLRAAVPVVRWAAQGRTPAHPVCDRLAADQARAADQPQGLASCSWT